MDELKNIFVKFVELKALAVRGEKKRLEELHQTEQILKEAGYDPEEFFREYLTSTDGSFPQLKKDNRKQLVFSEKSKAKGTIDEQSTILYPRELTDIGEEVQTEVLEETQRGLKITTRKSVFISCTGKTMEKVGGKCGVCGGYSEEIILCDGCKIALCPRDSFKWRTVDGEERLYCERCYGNAVAHDNLWVRLEREFNGRGHNEAL